MLFWNLGDFQEPHRSFVIDNGTSLDIGLGLVGQLHDIFCLRLDHVLQDAEINNGAQVVDIGKEEDLDASLNKLLKNTRVVERFEDISVSRRIPIRDGRFERLWCWEQRVFKNPGIPRLVEGHDVDVVALVFLDDVLGVIVGIEGVHENKGNIDVVGAVEVFDLSNGKIEE